MNLHICMPNYRAEVQQPTHLSMVQLAFHLGTLREEFDYNLPNNSSTAVAREELVEVVLDNPRATHALFIDDDMVFEAAQFERLRQTVVEGDLDFCCALAFSNSEPCKPCIFGKVPDVAEFDPDQPWWHICTDWPREQVFEIIASGFGMCIISKRMLEAMRRDANGDINPDYFFFDYIHKGARNEDIAFCINARKAGFKLHCDSRVSIGHIAKERHIIGEDLYDAKPGALEYAGDMELMTMPAGNGVELERPDARLVATG